ncbi:YqaA family protein [Magnetovibrio sp. PR-2]|uniref:YqaA family protein n=1 Tax=Magnetovibrio sp. PR-2 TaxID=3120356 RepID=UPI002FCE4419
MSGYLGLFFTAFLAATIFPFSSEAVLAGLSVSGGFEALWLWGVATAGNTLGAMVNWALGRWCLHWQDRKWFPFKADDLEKADRWFSKWGVWSLLLSWVPIIGDPITFAAGFLRVKFWLFSVLVLIAKGGRYSAVLLIAQGFL